MTNKLDHALDLAQKGFHVFPLEPDSKFPHIDDFPNKASRDPERIRRWWTCPVMGLEQDFNIGISTTHGLLVVDVDNKGGKSGDDSLLQIELEGKDFPPTFEQRTPTGGRHIIYRVDRPVKQSAGELGVGLDIRSRGGYIVGAGSTVPAGTYVADPRDIADAPNWLITACGYGTDKPKADQAIPEGINIERAVARTIDRLKALPSATQGDRNHAGFKAAALAKDYGVPEDMAMALLAEHWKCEPMLDPPELEHVVRSAYRYGANAPGAIAPEVEFKPVEVAPNLHPFDKVNEEYAFVLAGGGHHILWQTVDAQGNPALEHLSEGAFHKKHAAWSMLIGNKSKPVTELWMTAPNRRSYDGICFMPGQDAPDNFYNLWRGFSYAPSKTGSKAAKQSLQMFLEHTLQNVCENDKPLFNWLIGYFAHMIQKPWEKPLVALVFRGSKGTGKNALIERIGALLGNHFLLSSNRRYLVGNFNGHLENCLLFVLDEAFWSGDKQAEGTLKDLITGKRHVIEHKGKEPYTVDNRTRVAIIGNEDWIVPASHDERRFAVFNVGTGRKKDREFFRLMREGMEDGGYSLLLDYLQNFDLKGIDVNEAPQTAALLEQKHASLNPFESWWLDCLTDGKIIGADFAEGWPDSIETDRLRKALQRYCKDRGIKAWAPSNQKIGVLLRAVVTSVSKRRIRAGTDLSYQYDLPSLEECRKAWEEHIGHVVDW